MATMCPPRGPTAAATFLLLCVLLAAHFLLLRIRIKAAPSDCHPLAPSPTSHRHLLPSPSPPLPALHRRSHMLSPTRPPHWDPRLARVHSPVSPQPVAAARVGQHAAVPMVRITGAASNAATTDTRREK